MSEMARTSRRASRDKARRMIAGDPHAKVDASDWTPPESLNANAKTGLRPVSPRTYKHGGKIQGDRARKRADQAQRGINRNVKTANAELGQPHVGGYKKGGRSHKDMGGMADPRAQAAANLASAANRSAVPGSRFAMTPVGSSFARQVGIKKGGKVGKHACRGGAMKKGGKANYTGGTRPVGDRIARAKGGRTKGKTTVNIVIGAHHQQPMQQAGQMPPRPPQAPPAGMPVPVPTPMPPGMGPSIPPASMGGPPPQGSPMLPRKRGGRTNPHFTAGSGSGVGRLEKAHRAEEIIEKANPATREFMRKRARRGRSGYESLEAGSGSGLGRLHKVRAEARR